MLFLFIQFISSLNNQIKDFLLGKWDIHAREVSTDEDGIEFNHKYFIHFREYNQFSSIGDLIEQTNNSATELITTVKVDFNDLSLSVWTGSLRYFYKLIQIKLTKSRNQHFFAQGQFIDGTGNYFCSIFSTSRIDMTIYEKGKITFYYMDKNINKEPFSWLSKYFYVLPVAALFVFILAFLPSENKNSMKNQKVKKD